jgi:hypothetical protein
LRYAPSIQFIAGRLVDTWRRYTRLSTRDKIVGEFVIRLNVIHASAVGLGACAIAALLVPGVLLRGLGVTDASVAVLGVIRLSGVLMIALASILWSARFWLLSSMGASTLRVLAVVYGITAVMLLAQQVAAGRVLESVIPIVYVALLSLEYASTARRYSRRFGFSS